MWRIFYMKIIFHTTHCTIKVFQVLAVSHAQELLNPDRISGRGDGGGKMKDRKNAAVMWEINQNI
jgi:hypothetical protein